MVWAQRWLCWGMVNFGRMKQWGKSTSTGEYVTHTFPIKFTVIPIVVAGALTSNTSGNTGSQSNPCYRSITVSNFVFCMYDNARGYAGSTYIAIGYQLQWGYGNSESTQTFPIKFTNSVIGIYGSKRAINYEYTFAATSITNTNFFMSTRNSEGSSRVIACNWLAIGQQQTK